LFGLLLTFVDRGKKQDLTPLLRAGIVDAAPAWPWSSYLATAGLVESPEWLATDWLLSAFARKRSTAIKRYTAFVAAGLGLSGTWEQLRGQIYLGSDEFIEDTQCRMSSDTELDEVPGVQKKRLPRPLDEYRAQSPDRDTAIYRAYLSGGYSQKAIGDHFGLHYSRVSRIVKQQAEAKSKT
jgi:hypothetical protein